MNEQINNSSFDTPVLECYIVYKSGKKIPLGDYDDFDLMGEAFHMNSYQRVRYYRDSIQFVTFDRYTAEKWCLTHKDFAFITSIVNETLL